MNTTNVELLRTYLSARRLPARLDVQVTSLLLGIGEHELPVLVRAKLLKPLGTPMQNAKKHFAAVDVEALARDSNWLHRATNTIYRQWGNQNQKSASRINTIQSKE